MFDKTKKRIEEQGILISDVPKVLVTWKVLNFAIYGGMIALCYKKHPLIALSNKYKLEQKLATRFPSMYAKGQNFVNKRMI